jgi:sigma-E factor negative regulatory protein RseC
VTEQGTVVEVRDHQAKIELRPGDECAHCCAGFMCKSGNGGLRYFEVENAAEAQIGDVVEIYLPSQNVFLSAFLVYIVPLIALVAGYVIGKAASGSENVGIIAAVLALVAAYLSLRVVDSRVARASKWRPVMRRVIARGSE